MENEQKQINEKINKDDFESYLTVWKHYEDVAMHFNDLIIRLRLQSIGGLAALATIIGIISKYTGGNEALNYNLAIIAIVCLMFLWGAIWALDLRYYNRLLEGSVNAILELEKNKNNYKNVTLSSNIEKAFDIKFEHEKGKQIEIKKGKIVKNGRKWFYGLVFSALAFLLVVTIVMRLIDCKPEENTSEINPKVVLPCNMPVEQGKN